MLRRALFLLALPLALEAQSARDSVVSTTVTRTVRLVPDRASLFVSVEGSAETAKEAITRAEAKVTAVRETLLRLPAGTEVGAAVPFSVGPTQTVRGFPGAPSGPSFTARTAIRIQTGRLSSLAATVAAALDAGATQSTNPVFESSAADSVRRVTLADALSAARREAEAVAVSLGGRLGALVDVSTTGTDRLQQPNMFAFDGGFSGPSVAPEVVISVTATVRYRIVR